jgi:hypothetical protein
MGCILRFERLAGVRIVNQEEHPDGKGTGIEANAEAVGAII